MRVAFLLTVGQSLKAGDQSSMPFYQSPKAFNQPPKVFEQALKSERMHQLRA
jgi:hypothetical protein